jgi:hypothetical protein
MEGFSDKQNEVFGKIFGELKKRKPNFQTDALAMLKLDDENFTKLFNDVDNEITGDDEDIHLCYDRAKHLGID